MNILKKLIRYTVTLAISVLLLWWVFKDQDTAALFSGFKEAKYSWIVLSVIISVLVNVIRAFRWNLLLEPMGYRPAPFRTFLALMVGYFSNIFVPRMGEVTRCGILTRTDKVPFSFSFGSVIAERFVDLFSLILLIGLAFILEFDKLNQFVTPFIVDKLAGLQGPWVIYLASAGLVFLMVLLFIYKAFRVKINNHPLFIKLAKLAGELFKGLTSIRNVKHQFRFWTFTALIWIFYYFMGYVVIHSFPATENLSWLAGVSILVMGAIGMAAPVQGGLGTYHLLVSGVLVLYGVTIEDGLIFATVIHASQTLTVILVGAISFFISLVIESNNNKEIVHE